MSAFTPTAASAATAGFGFYALFWACLAKIDTILALFRIRNRTYAKRGRLWVNENKGLTLCLTELVNFGIHGVTNPAAVTFAIGGTVFNALYIFVLNPLICWQEKKEHRPLSLHKVA